MFGIFLSKFLNGDFYRLNLIRKPFSEPFRNIRNQFRTVRVKAQNLKTKTTKLKFPNGLFSDTIYFSIFAIHFPDLSQTYALANPSKPQNISKRALSIPKMLRDNFTYMQRLIIRCNRV